MCLTSERYSQRRAMKSLRVIRLEPIGFVRTEASPEDLKNRIATSKIVIRKEFSKGLDGIGGFSHFFVLFWMHKTSKPDKRIMKVHPRHRLYLPKQGIFATRTQFRPNSIGLTVVKLVRRVGDTLIVNGLDAYDGTPVLDLKPYDPWDRLGEIRVPTWWKKLEKEKERNESASHLG